MDNNHIISIIRETTQLLGQGYDDALLSDQQVTPRQYALDELPEFIRDLVEAGNKGRVIFLENTGSINEFPNLVSNLEIPVIVFERHDENLPVLIFKRKGKCLIKRIDDSEFESAFNLDDCRNFYTNSSGEIIFLAAFSFKNLVSEESEEDSTPPLTPFQRLIRLLAGEKSDILHIILYSLFIGVVGLTLPLGIQATVELVSGGVVVTSVYVLIALVIIGVLVAGGLQIMQILVVEYLQRRIFTKAALEFAFRVPRIRLEAIINQYAPELMNRFFDVLTLQKGLPKLLIDLSVAVMQILFGLILLSFYHPFFVFFGLGLLAILGLIFRLTGPLGLATSIQESKYKYKVVYWLEELARALNSFKLSGNTSLPLKKTEYNLNNYLKNRKAHFAVLISQYTYIILFKAVVTGGLLIIGTFLVINREITLGQFVASEVIIILVLSSVEKIILYMEVVYDLLTAVDKIGHVTDLPIERSGGIDISQSMNGQGLAIDVNHLNYRYPDSSEYSLKDINLRVKAGEKICISGGGASGKTTLTDTITGLHTGYEGIITFNNFSLRDLDLTNLRDWIGKNVSHEDIFDGTIQENILVGKPNSTPEHAVEAIRLVGLDKKINQFPDGLNTHMVSAGKGFSNSFINKLILARCLAKRPRLLILNDYFDTMQKQDKLELINLLTRKDHAWTLLVISNDPIIMSCCDRVIVLDQGSIVADGPYDELLSDKSLNELIAQHAG